MVAPSTSPPLTTPPRRPRRWVSSGSMAAFRKGRTGTGAGPGRRWRSSSVEPKPPRRASFLRPSGSLRAVGSMWSPRVGTSPDPSRRSLPSSHRPQGSRRWANGWRFLRCLARRSQKVGWTAGVSFVVSPSGSETVRWTTSVWRAPCRPSQAAKALRQNRRRRVRPGSASTNASDGNRTGPEHTATSRFQHSHALSSEPNSTDPSRATDRWRW